MKVVKRQFGFKLIHIRRRGLWRPKLTLLRVNIDFIVRFQNLHGIDKYILYSIYCRVLATGSIFETRRPKNSVTLFEKV